MAERQEQAAPDALLTRIGQVVMLHHGGDREEARERLLGLWAELGEDGDPLHRCTLAHYLADTQDDPTDELAWDLRALSAADELTDGRHAGDSGDPGDIADAGQEGAVAIRAFYPSPAPQPRRGLREARPPRRRPHPHPPRPKRLHGPRRRRLRQRGAGRDRAAGAPAGGRGPGRGRGVGAAETAAVEPRGCPAGIGPSPLSGVSTPVGLAADDRLRAVRLPAAVLPAEGADVLRVLGDRLDRVGDVRARLPGVVRLRVRMGLRPGVRVGAGTGAWAVRGGVTGARCGG